MEKKPTVSGAAEVSTLKTSDYGLRAVANMIKIPLEQQPEGQAHSDLASDLFLSLYTDEVSPKDGVVNGRELNQQLMKWVQENSDWDNTRQGTQFNLPSAMFTAGMVWLHCSTDDVIKEAIKKQEQASEKGNEADRYQSMSEALMGAHQESGDNDLFNQAQELADMAMKSAKRSDQLMDHALKKFSHDAQDNGFKQAGINSAITQANEQAKEFAKLAAGWGHGPGSDIYQDPTAVIRFVEENQGKLAQLAKLAGRLKGFVLQGRKERAPMGHTPTAVDITRNIPRLLPTELMKLSPQQPSIIRFEAVAQLSSNGLLGYTPDSDKDEDGAVVCATDVSPSMRGARELVAKALSLAVGLVKKQNGKPYFLFNFASDPNYMKNVSDKDDLAKHFEWAKHASSGGTDFNMALREAMRLLRTLPDEGRNADLLFHSDGEGKVSTAVVQEWRTFQEETGARLFYVPVGKSYYQDMERIADKVIHLSELTETTGVDLAKAVGQWLR